ncbi:MAG: 2-oxoglutarate dehydrogenase complex dihydrolipoyllysine-residue succinyltransferase [Legionellales bacterium]|jgi:2-oxoglutarate dehydrogenase E2 component (dihydrolipoamide succinyltransferase)|nr:2-oxoglutarate dehydrogenase complex dihydrolipoyllysine-residue succinyltransferase [Legionellales bacterium]
MTVEIKVPVLPESVSDATVAAWHKNVGDAVAEGESLLDLETDKIMLEVPAPSAGVLTSILQQEGEVVVSGQALGALDTAAVAVADTSVVETAVAQEGGLAASSDSDSLQHGPAVRKLLHEHNVDASLISGTGKSGRLTVEDVKAYLSKTASTSISENEESTAVAVGSRYQERVAMTRLRQRIAERLLDAQQNAAILTTFNEVDMQPVMDLRVKYKELFQKTHDTKLGFMSFFVKATIAALKQFPEVNAAIDGTDIVYNNFFDIGLAVSSPRGLVVPILRNAELLAMADIEKQIIDYAGKAKNGTLTLEEMTGGTFTITNGGTFGSMLSTPILNPPQSAILGMHNIVKRAVVVNDEIVIRPMMYLALSYDHRIIDGATSVRFLVTIKEMLEDPARLLLNI